MIVRIDLCSRLSPTPRKRRMASGWRSSSVSILPSSRACMAAEAWIKCRLAPCKPLFGLPRSVIGCNTLFTPNPGTTSIFSDSVIDQTREFFTSFVSGRGALPAIRIGGQPYGILPVTAFSRIAWYRGDRRIPIRDCLSPF